MAVMNIYFVFIIRSHVDFFNCTCAKETSNFLAFFDFRRVRILFAGFSICERKTYDSFKSEEIDIRVYLDDIQ